MQLELIEGARLLPAGFLELLVELLCNGLNVGVALRSSGCGLEPPGGAERRVIRGSMVHHENEDSEGGDGTDAAHQDGTGPERLLLESPESRKP